jgi:uncharacterized FlaG/YvyC family protein
MTISSVTSGIVPADTGEGTRALAKAASATREAQKTTVVEPSTQGLSQAHVAQAASQVNASFTKNGLNLHAVITKDKATGIDVVIFQDKDTNEVISQSPPKVIIAMAEAINQSLDKKGQMLNVNA